MQYITFHAFSLDKGKNYPILLWEIKQNRIFRDNI